MSRMNRTQRTSIYNAYGQKCEYMGLTEISKILKGWGWAIYSQDFEAMRPIHEDPERQAAVSALVDGLETVEFGGRVYAAHFVETRDKAWGIERDFLRELVFGRVFERQNAETSRTLGVVSDRAYIIGTGQDRTISLLWSPLGFPYSGLPRDREAFEAYEARRQKWFAAHVLAEVRRAKIRILNEEQIRALSDASLKRYRNKAYTLLSNINEAQKSYWEDDSSESFISNATARIPVTDPQVQKALDSAHFIAGKSKEVFHERSKLARKKALESAR